MYIVIHYSATYVQQYIQHGNGMYYRFVQLICVSKDKGNFLGLLIGSLRIMATATLYNSTSVQRLLQCIYTMHGAIVRTNLINPHANMSPCALSEHRVSGYGQLRVLQYTRLFASVSWKIKVRDKREHCSLMRKREIM